MNFKLGLRRLLLIAQLQVLLSFFFFSLSLFAGASANPSFKQKFYFLKQHNANLLSCFVVS